MLKIAIKSFPLLSSGETKYLFFGDTAYYHKSEEL